MTSPRGEAIKKSHLDDVSIATPIEGDETANKIDHYGVLGKLMRDGTSHFLADQDTTNSFQSAQSLNELTDMMQQSMTQSMIRSIQAPEIADAFANLATSQRQRSAIDDERHSRIEGNISSGVETFLTVFSKLATILDGAYGKEVATHPGNWRIADRIAKLHGERSSAYTTTYLHTSENVDAFLEQLELRPDGGLQFSPHYPKSASVSIWTTRSDYKFILCREDIVLSENPDTIRIEDIEVTTPEIGCPVTFDSTTVKELWSVFSGAAASIATWADKQSPFERWALERALIRDGELTDAELQARFNPGDSEASRK